MRGLRYGTRKCSANGSVAALSNGQAVPDRLKSQSSRCAGENNMVEYKANYLERLAQRFIYPLHRRDGLGGYEFSSTVTFARYKAHYLCIFAAHALAPREHNLKNIGLLTTTGEFIPLSDSCQSEHIFTGDDVAVGVSDAPFEGRNYFSLEEYKSKTQFVTDSFGWIGFPLKKAQKKIHSSKARPEDVLRSLTSDSDGQPVWEHANFLLIGAMIESKTCDKITGRHDNKNVEYRHEGFKAIGYSPKGMSGGALIQGPVKVAKEPEDAEDFWQFVGIGIEYDGSIITGVTRERILELAQSVLDDQSKERSVDEPPASDASQPSHPPAGVPPGHEPPADNEDRPSA